MQVQVEKRPLASSP